MREGEEAVAAGLAFKGGIECRWSGDLQYKSTAA